MNRLLRCFLICVLLVPPSGGLVYGQIAGFTASPTSGCSPLTVQFTNTSAGPISSYSWNFGNTNTSTLQSPSTTYTAPGTYIVTLTVTGATGSDTRTDSIVVFDQPTVSFAANPTSGCIPLNVQFISSVVPHASGSMIYFWDFGDGYTSGLANPAHTYTSAGTYNVALSVTNGAGCVRTVQLNNYITVYPLPVPSFTASPVTACVVPAAITFTSSATGNAPLITNWTFGDGGIGTGSPASHSYGTSGSFNVTMKVTDGHGCIDSLVKPSLININTSQGGFTAPASACRYAYVTFVDTTTGSLNGSWNFGDGQSAVGTLTTHAYSSPGNYLVTLSTTVGGCQRTAAHNIVIDPLPVANFTYSPPCPPQTSIQFTSTSTGASTYAWTSSRGTGTGPTYTAIYPYDPTNHPTGHAVYLDNVKLVAISSAGCKDSLTIDTVYVRNLLVSINELYITGLPITGCAPYTVEFEARALTTVLPIPPAIPPPPIPYPYGISTSRAWNFGDGDTSTLTNPSHTYINRGVYTVRCIMVTSNGCRDTGYRTVTVDTPVHPTVSITPDSVCARVPVTFAISSTTPQFTNFYWELGDTSFARTSLDTFTHAFRKSGIYTLNIYTNHNGCVDTLKRTNYLKVNPSSSMFVDSLYCAPSLAMQFIDSSVLPTSHYWTFGDGATSTLANPLHNYPDTGVYIVSLVTNNNVYGCTDTFTYPVPIYHSIFDFSASDTTICKDGIVQFFGTIKKADYGVYGSAWKIDSVLTTFDVGPAYSVQYATRGYHTVSWLIKTGRSGACIDTLTKTNYVLVSQPQIYFTATPPIGCKPLMVILTDSSKYVSGTSPVYRKWTFGDGDTASNNNPATSHIYQQVGFYDVKLLAIDDQGCKDSLLVSDFIAVRKPVASFYQRDSACKGAAVQFSDSSKGATALTYQWSFGDGGTASQQHPLHTYATAGTYTIRLIVADSTGCSDTAVRSILISSPHASFTMSNSVGLCRPFIVSFNGSSSTGAAHYDWNFGNGNGPVTNATPVTTYFTPNKYAVQLVVTDLTGCTDTARDSIRVLGYNGSFSYSPTDVCVGAPVFFNANVTNIPQLRWDFADGTTVVDTSSTISHVYTNPGPYLPKLIYSDGTGCAEPSTGLTTIKVDNTIANFTWSKVLCVGTPFTLTDSSRGFYSGINAWSWDLGGGAANSDSVVLHSYPVSGNYPITLIATNALGCKDTVTKNVFINPPPVVDAGDNQPICPGDSTIFTATGAQTYTWTPAALVNCLSGICDAVKVWTAAPTTYYVSGTDTNGCVGKDSAVAFIQIKTETHVGTGGEICVGESFQLFATGATRYSWTPAATLNNSSINNPIATPQITTTYILEAQKTTCLISFDTITVIVHPLPLFDAGFDETVNLGESVLLHPTKRGIDHILWRQDTTLSCNYCFDPRARPYYTKMYYATGYDEYGCGASDSVTVFVRCNGSLVFIPNTFSPNGDGSNDYFFPRGEGAGAMASFRIFNRWGQMVYERNNVALNDEHAGWDGTYQGQALAPDVYMYTMQARCEDGKMVTWKGDVTLVR